MKNIQKDFYKMKVKFITAIYSNLAGTEFGGRPSRGSHYRYSLLSLLKMTDADFICYTNSEELEGLKSFFYKDFSISEEKLKFVLFDIADTKFKEIINSNKDVEGTKRSDRCVEIQYSKFHWWWNEDKSYDYYYWIDAGLSHCGLLPNKYLTYEGDYMRRFYESDLFNNTFLKNLIDFTKDKIFIIQKDNVRNYWSGTVDQKWYTNHCSDYHTIGGLFGGHKDNWDNLVTIFENYVYNIITTDKKIPMEENLMSLMYYNNPDLFVTVKFDTWWCADNGPSGLSENYFNENKSFYKIIEELNGIYE
jgi:hypothetical protein